MLKANVFHILLKAIQVYNLEVTLFERQPNLFAMYLAGVL